MDGETSEDHVYRLARLHDSSNNLCDIQKRRSLFQLLCRRKLEWVNVCHTMRLWGKDEERGVLWACIAAIAIFLLVIPDPDTDLTVVFPGNPPYSWLWYLLNPLYWTKRSYSMIIFAEGVGVT